MSRKKTDTLMDKDIVSASEQNSLQLLDSLDGEANELQGLYTKMAEIDSPEDLNEMVQIRLRSIKRTSGNIRKAYYRSARMLDELNARWEDLSRDKPKRFLPTVPANARIDLEEHQTNHFAQGLSIYKLMLICFTGSFAGVVIEMLWCLLTRGYIESRAGLIYGPFNLLYGAGAVFLSIALYKFRNRGKWISF